MKKNERRRGADGKIEANLTTEKRPLNVENQDQGNDSATRRFRSFFEFGLAASSVAAIFCAPEGSIREGDFLPVAFFLLAFGVATFFFAFRLKRKFKENGNSQSVENKRLIAFGRVADFSLFAYLLGTLFSFGKLVVCESGDVRLSTNAIWTFATPPLLYFFVRYFKMFYSKRLAKNVCVLFIACAVAESGFSAYSYFVVNPRLRAEYRANPDGMLKQNGMTLAPGSRERLLFEKRLLDSSEPTGTYGLANTLAGFLAPTFVLALVLSGGFLKRNKATKFFSDGSCLAAIVVWVATLLTIGFILVATKSRAGLLATVFGLGVWRVVSIASAIRSGGVTLRRVAFFVGGAAILGVVGIGAAFATGIIDREVFAEAGKSLGYRLDYWRASAAMTRDFPLFGVGPGEYQNVYPQYVAPTASEFIADPHNFAFELAALFGLPALVSFCIFLAAIFAASFCRRGELRRIENGDVKEESNKAFFVGAWVGVPLAFGCSLFQSAPLDVAFLAFAFLAFGLVLTSALRLIRGVDSKTQTVAATAALAALFLNLCAAGGIGYPSISIPAFLLAASISTCVRREDSSYNGCEKTIDKDERLEKRAIFPTAFLMATSIFVVFYTTAFRPRSNDFLFSIRVATPDGADVYRDVFELGTPEKIDARSLEVVSQCYYRAARKYFDKPSPENRTRWNLLRDKALKTSPNSAPSRENWGDFDFALFERNRTRREFLVSATDFYRGSVEKSPTETEKRFKYVRALRASGDLDQAFRQANKTLELDAGTPHLDRKLSSKNRAELSAFIDEKKGR